MSTTTDEIFENENEEVQEPRKLDVLLALETYQGMTDEEIQMVLDYKIDQAVASRKTLAEIAAINAKSEQCIADNQASAQAAQDMIQSLVEREFPMVPLMEPSTSKPTLLVRQRSIGA